MAQINKPSEYFETTTYAGGTTAITSLDFSPDWVWAKKRTGAENHGIFDSVRGVYQTINSNTTAAESTRSGALTSFDSNGWSMGGADGIISASGNDYVAWSWRASDSSPVSNTDGSITSTVSANTTSGFSIVSYTGTGSNATIGHGLGQAPDMIIVKRRDSGDGWKVYNSPRGATKYLQLNTTDAEGTLSSQWNDTEPTSSVFSVGTAGDINGSGRTYIAYCISNKKGFSKVGSYTGNGSSDGTFVYTGFKPAFLIRKRTDSAVAWYLHDNKRDGYNVTQKWFSPNDSDAESTTQVELRVDFLSNGFKMRDPNGAANASGGSYIYMAFAEEPLVGTNNIPATAR